MNKDKGELCAVAEDKPGWIGRIKNANQKAVDIISLANDVLGPDDGNESLSKGPESLAEVMDAELWLLHEHLDIIISQMRRIHSQF